MEDEKARRYGRGGRGDEVAAGSVAEEMRRRMRLSPRSWCSRWAWGGGCTERGRVEERAAAARAGLGEEDAPSEGERRRERRRMDADCREAGERDDNGSVK